MSSGCCSAPFHFFNPLQPNHVWNMDMATLRVLWMRCEVAAIIEGSSWKIVGLIAFRGTSTTVDLVDLIDQAVQNDAVPSFIVTDRSGQFQSAFRVALASRGIRHARG